MIIMVIIHPVTSKNADDKNKKDYLLITLNTSWLIAVGAQEPALSLPQGRIVGVRTYPDSSPLPVDVFLGIPYASAPVGRLRFMAPVRHPGWNRTLFAHRVRARCPAPAADPGHTSGDLSLAQTPHSEDCLYLNIWTPQGTSGGGSRGLLAPVLVVVGGSGWSGERAAAAGLVVATVSARAGPLGWLTLRAPPARGNLPLLDHYVALLWLRDNIASFGGDPAALTLLAHGTHADLLLHHLVSPRIQGLIKRAIILSPRRIWQAVERDEGESSAAAAQAWGIAAALLGCGELDPSAVVRCLQLLPLHDLLRITYNGSDISSMGPVADDFLPPAAQYSPKPLAEALAQPPALPIPLPLLFGTAELEAIDYEDGWSKLAGGGPEMIRLAEEGIISNLLRRLGLDSLPVSEIVREAIRWEYNLEEDSGLVLGVARAQSQAQWGAGGALLAARLARLAHPLYVYRYTGHDNNYTGAAHRQDVAGALGAGLAGPRIQDSFHSKRIRSLLTNFAKYGEPDTVGDGGGAGGREAWRAYRVGGGHVQALGGREGPADRRATAFWLAHLQRLANLTAAAAVAAPPLLSQGVGGREGQLVGALWGLAALSAALLGCAAACALLLRRTARARAQAAAAAHDFDVPSLARTPHWQHYLTAEKLY